MRLTSNDNTGHHKGLNLPTYPDYKHVENGNNVVAAFAPELHAVLEEIESILPLQSGV